MENEAKQQALATRVALAGSEEERQALLVWMLQLLQIRDGSLSTFRKGQEALRVTLQSQVIWPMVKILGHELKRIGWDERGTKGRAGVIGVGLGVTLFGGQGAGIAALGGAIGVPLWIVLGAGAYFAAGLVEELRKSLPVSKHPQYRDGRYEVIDVDAKKLEE
ncbi:hypothetical protein H8N03_25895 [Ramlibacter sp. USB13]|uniref:Uncharacterized protein n=1 Tax=Ramlibacter cellulosilyticus TaxID=2764187 RepID=A0A923MVZ8_9BURK|nr:hypothetical protein [Ramlibacter cellulosilyticus]MBC5786395.1 hypothetical protein [Ramlibacter cellulosilyticus]